MDVIFKLRFLFWALVACLWGLLFREFYYEAPSDIPQIQPVHNPFSSSLAAAEGENLGEPARVGDAVAAVPAAPEPFLPPSFTRAIREDRRAERRELREELKTARQEAPAETLPAGEMLLPVAPQGLRPLDLADRVATKPKTAARPPSTPPRTAPIRLHTAETRHFVVQSQSEAGEAFLKNLEAIHENIMIDLAPFSPWARDEKVAIFLFDDQRSYEKYTGRPEWSGGASSLSRRSVYAYKSDELMGILAHEMTHIYFDGFFGDRPSPLWLSEGLATLEQAERGFSPPNWLAPDLQRISVGAGFPLDRLIAVDTTAGADDDTVRLWYAESYSVVRFMLRMQRGPAFLHFCRGLRDGMSIGRSLLLAYGMPYNRLKALELAWRYDLSNHRLTGRAAVEPS